jgi:carboxyl-terminal processing protease
MKHAVIFLLSLLLSISTATVAKEPAGGDIQTPVNGQFEDQIRERLKDQKEDQKEDQKKDQSRDENPDEITPEEPHQDGEEGEKQKGKDQDQSAEDKSPEEKKKQRTPLQTLRLFAEAYSRIKQNYVESVDDKELIEHAIRGMLEGLDPHSDFLMGDDYLDLKESTHGEFGGLGLEVGAENGFIKVIAPIDDTPAQKAGVKAGDLIIRLDGKPVKGMSLSKAVKSMRGKPGTELMLTILREGEEQPLQIKVVRDIIHIVSVKSRLLEERFGYIRISNFQIATARNLLEKVEKLQQQADGSLKGLILDLRNNPGGVLTAAVAVSDAFLDDGLIVYTEGRTADSKITYSATANDILDGEPIVVLVNEGSASASEIVAGALQDHRRAVIVGQQTFGKGSVQTVVPVMEEAAIKLTTARYYTPLGRSIQAEGIKPDIELAPVSIELSKKISAHSIKEKDLTGHLVNGDGEKEQHLKPEESGGEGKTAKDPQSGDDKQQDEEKQESSESGDGDSDDNSKPDDEERESPDGKSDEKLESQEKVLISEDYALSEALNLLKGMSIFLHTSADIKQQDEKAQHEHKQVGKQEEQK